MIEAIMLKLGFSGMIALALAATIVGGSIYTKLALARKDALLAKKTTQIQEIAYERDQLLNANRAFKQVVMSQNTTIENYIREGNLQKQRADKAVAKAQSVQEEWQAYLNHLDQSIGQGDRWNTVKQTYGDAMAKWNRGDTAPSEVP